MAFARSVQRQIETIESFAEVVLSDKNGYPISRLKMGIPRYPWVTPASDDWTIADWKRERFEPLYGLWTPLIFAYDFHQRLHQVRDTMKLSFVRRRSEHLWWK